MPQLLKMTLRGEPEYINVAKLAIGAAASKVGFDVEGVLDLELAVEEACKAITCHGHEGWSHSYVVESTFVDDVLKVSIADSGEGHTREKGESCGPCIDCPNEGNLGFHIIKSLVDEVEVVTNDCGHKEIVMVKKK